MARRRVPAPRLSVPPGIAVLVPSALSVIVWKDTWLQAPGSPEHPPPDKEQLNCLGIVRPMPWPGSLRLVGCKSHELASHKQKKTRLGGGLRGAGLPVPKGLLLLT